MAQLDVVHDICTASLPAFASDILPFGIVPYDALSRSLSSAAAKALPARCASVIVFLFPYYTGPLPARRNISRYAMLLDYHGVAMDFLRAKCAALSAAFSASSFVPFADSSPIPEVETAARAGLGVRGYNNQLLHSQYGPYCFIGEIVTDLALPVAAGAVQTCVQCGACLRACPTGALSAKGPGAFQKQHCRSWISQKKGALTDWEAAQLKAGGLAWGCDICLDACPTAQTPMPTPIYAFAGHQAACLTSENIPAVAAAHSCGWRGEGVLRRNLALLDNDVTL